jgi:hypothetical protein
VSLFSRAVANYHFVGFECHPPRIRNADANAARNPDFAELNFQIRYPVEFGTNRGPTFLQFCDHDFRQGEQRVLVVLALGINDRRDGKLLALGTGGGARAVSAPKI